jgi:hypothetical protein
VASEHDGDPSGDQDFFAAVEERFVALRGASVLLSPADWQLARGWRREGIPLDLILSALALAFERHRARRRGGRISSLRYCQPLVEQLWRERLALGPLAPVREVAPPLDVPSRLAALAALLPPGLADRTDLERAILALEGDAQEVEEKLARLDERCLEREGARLDPAARADLAAAIERSLAPLRSRLDPAAFAAAHGRLWSQALRRRLGLPELSLFASAIDRDPSA